MKHRVTVHVLHVEHTRCCAYLRHTRRLSESDRSAAWERSASCGFVPL